MDMDHLIGQRFNLISKSEIRYLGTLHKINPEKSTIALEDVYSFGTEGRLVKDFIPASSQKFDYIVFRGTDVKDIKIAEDQKENSQPQPSVPNDPAILNASRPGQPSPQGLQLRDQPSFSPQNFSQPSQHRQVPQFQNYYPQYGRGFGPLPGPFPPGPGFQGMPYGPPPPGYFGPPFPPPPQMPIGPPGQRLSGGPLQQSQPGPQAPNELPVNDRAQESIVGRSVTPISTVSPAPGPTPPIDSKPSVAEALAPVPSAATPVPASASVVVAAAKVVTATSPVPFSSNAVASGPKAPPSGPKSTRIVPALPMTVNAKSSAPITSLTTNGRLATASDNAAPPTAPKAPAPAAQMAMEDATLQARAAVANAMAKMNLTAHLATAQHKPVVGGNAVDKLATKVGEMKTSDGPRGGRGGTRGQRGSFRNGSTQGRGMEIPTSDYDFASANEKFNKKDMIKEAIASGPPIRESSNDGVNRSGDIAPNGENLKDTVSAVTTEAYNKSTSFFDNISSEARDRKEAAAGRGRRGEEIKKNLETFGQGSVDVGFRGRGRGGFRGRGRPYGGQRGYGSYGRGGGGGQRGRRPGGFEAAQA